MSCSNSTRLGMRVCKPGLFAARLSSSRICSRAKCRHIVRAFTITLHTPEGQKKMECDGDTYVLDAADDAGLDLPYSCRSGTCGTCAAKIDDASQIEQDNNSYLEEGMLEKGFFLTCTSYPKADITIKTNQEDNVFD